jgi:Meiotically Up-regulated Gene 113 (MUG113) protein
MPRIQCPFCHKPTKLADTFDRAFYRTAFGVRHLEGRPEAVGWIIDEKPTKARRALFRQFACVCWACRDAFIETRSGVILAALDSVVERIRSRIQHLETDLSNLSWQHGAALGARDYVRTVRDHAKERTARESLESGYVYAIRAGNHVKIGWAKDLDKRLAALQTSSARRMQLLGSVVGFARDERKIQDRFQRYHVRGEWYRDVPVNRKFFGALRKAQYELLDDEGAA